MRHRHILGRLIETGQAGGIVDGAAAAGAQRQSRAVATAQSDLAQTDRLLAALDGTFHVNACGDKELELLPEEALVVG